MMRHDSNALAPPRRTNLQSSMSNEQDMSSRQGEMVLEAWLVVGGWSCLSTLQVSTYAHST